MHPRHLLNLFVYSTSTNGLLLWYIAVCTSRLKVLIVLTRANDYDSVVFIMTTIEKHCLIWGVDGLWAADHEGVRVDVDNVRCRDEVVTSEKRCLI